MPRAWQFVVQGASLPREDPTLLLRSFPALPGPHASVPSSPGEPGSMTVTWTTWVPTRSEVQFGTKLSGPLLQRAQGAASPFVDGGVLRRKLYIHRVTLRGLLPGAQYGEGRQEELREEAWEVAEKGEQGRQLCRAATAPNSPQAIAWGRAAWARPPWAPTGDRAFSCPQCTAAAALKVGAAGSAFEP